MESQIAAAEEEFKKKLSAAMRRLQGCKFIWENLVWHMLRRCACCGFGMLLPAMFKSHVPLAGQIISCAGRHCKREPWDTHEAKRKCFVSFFGLSGQFVESFSLGRMPKTAQFQALKHACRLPSFQLSQQVGNWPRQSHQNVLFPPLSQFSFLLGGSVILGPALLEN